MLHLLISFLPLVLILHYLHPLHLVLQLFLVYLFLYYLVHLAYLHPLFLVFQLHLAYPLQSYLVNLLLLALRLNQRYPYYQYILVDQFDLAFLLFLVPLVFLITLVPLVYLLNLVYLALLHQNLEHPVYLVSH